MIAVRDTRLCHYPAQPTLTAVETKEAEPMDAAENKELMRDAFAELAKGNGRPFVDLLGDDVRWRIIGTTDWSGTWEGKSAVQRGLLDPLFAQFATPYRSSDVRLIAEDDWVVIEFRGDVTTTSGRPYRNTYCYVCRLDG